MSELTQEQIVRLYNVVDFSPRESIERAYMGDNRIETTIRDTKTNELKSFTINFIGSPEMLDFVINGIRLERN